MESNTQTAEQTSSPVQSTSSPIQVSLYQITDNLTKNIRIELADRSKDIITHTQKVFQDMLRGVRHDVCFLHF